MNIFHYDHFGLLNTNCAIRIFDRSLYKNYKYNIIYIIIYTYVCICTYNIKKETKLKYEIKGNML